MASGDDGVNSPRPNFSSIDPSGATPHRISPQFMSPFPSRPAPSPHAHTPRRGASRSPGGRLILCAPQHLSGGSTSPVLAGPSAGSARRRSLSAPAARPPRSAPAGPTPVGGEKLEHRSNPVLDADWPDPDVIRVGDDYWMIASSF